MEEVVKSMGFESLEEFNRMISEADLSTEEKANKFKEWQINDGTKVGLLALSYEPRCFFARFEEDEGDVVTKTLKNFTSLKEAKVAARDIEARKPSLTLCEVVEIEIVNIEDVKVGDYFKKLAKGVPSNETYTRQDYDRTTKRYTAAKHSDIWGTGVELKKGTKVCINFEF